MNENATLHLTHGATAVQTRLGSAASAATRWLNSRNQLLSDMMERTVTNRQALHVWHALTAFAVMLMLSCSIPGALFGLAWTALAFTLARKGGLR